VFQDKLTNKNLAGDQPYSVLLTGRLTNKNLARDHQSSPPAPREPCSDSPPGSPPSRPFPLLPLVRPSCPVRRPRPPVGASIQRAGSRLRCLSGRLSLSRPVLCGQFWSLEEVCSPLKQKFMYCYFLKTQSTQFFTPSFLFVIPYLFLSSNFDKIARDISSKISSF
jgi:hypothetical protein